jgi:hypothetical protein
MNTAYGQPNIANAKVEFIGSGMRKTARLAGNVAIRD